MFLPCFERPFRSLKTPLNTLIAVLEKVKYPRRLTAFVKDVSILQLH